jgi:hypothetical protein
MKYSNLTKLNNCISQKNILIRHNFLLNGGFDHKQGYSHGKLIIERFGHSTANKEGNAQSFGSKPFVPKTENTATTAIKKRLDSVFLNSEFVLAVVNGNQLKIGLNKSIV